jgi:hypothetical protein
MKKILLFASVLLSLSFVACDEDDGFDKDLTPIEDQYTGALAIKVFDNTDNIVGNVPVYLYLTYEDLRNDYALRVKSTTGAGVVQFTELLEGSYYVRTGKTLADGWYADTGVVQVLVSRQTNRELYLSK